MALWNDMLVAYSPHLVQIGTLTIQLKAGPSNLQSTSWANLTLDILRSLAISESDQEPLTALVILIEHPGINLHLEYCLQEDHLVIRVCLLPSDVIGSTWKSARVQEVPRRKALTKLFDYLKDGWEGGGRPVWRWSVEDGYRMAEMYASVPSPPEPYFTEDSVTCATDRDVYSRLMALEEPQGIKTRMYQYQFRSVARMLQMETTPRSLVDPVFTLFSESGREGSYYINFSNWDIQKHPSQYELPRGGILCEQMGVGKTLICLALIIATLHQPVRPPRVSLDDHTPLTDHTLHTYPFPRYAQAREAKSIDPYDTRLRLPSLVDLCSNILVGKDHSAKRSEYAPQALVDRLKEPTFYYVTPMEDDCVRAAKRKYLNTMTETFSLAHTTLVVVPRILLGQWRDEIDKHVVEGTLTVLEIKGKVLPSIQEMSQYDIVLMDVARFGQEESLRRFHLDLEKSEFLKARWKRIILDEGHVAGDANPSNAMRLAMAMSIERRWVVSGTPSKHLQQGGEEQMQEDPVDEPNVPEVDTTVEKEGTAPWSHREITDVQRLGSMMGGFLAVEPFASEKVFAERVTSNIRNRKGPKFGGVRRLQYLMSELMVKHAPRIIDSEANLPPSEISTVLLKFHPMQRITYNVLAALVASNVYTSNFEDQDYFLHPKNLTSFNQVVRNLHLATFWYSARHMGLLKCLERVRFHLQNNQNLTEQARDALNEVVAHFETAVDYPGWIEWMEHAVSVPYNVTTDEIPVNVKGAWSDSGFINSDIIAADSLKILRNRNLPGVTEQDLVDAGNANAASKVAAAEAEDEEDKRLYKEKKKTAPAVDGEDSKSAAHAPTAVPKRVINKRARAPKDQDDDPLLLRLDEAAWNAQQELKMDLGPPPLPLTLHIQSRSAKVNFVVNEILTSEADKFVIFGDVFELGHLTEALDLADVKSCFVGMGISPTRRAESLREFEQPDIKVCLLDLKLGARGLNLVAANRLILLAPIWSLDVQAQAIKRIHRIGQTRATKIQTLVMEGTFEEDIARRSSSTRTEREEQVYSRAMIEKPRFVYVEDDGETSFPIRFIPQRPAPTSPQIFTPDSAMPITPIVKQGIDSVRIITSPTPAARVAPILKRKSESKIEEPKGKKSRVAFA